ncbi:hypothetical protein XENTR_v10024432 [Xenopus tropicalis]|nr:hypothetical protein XENTR_v10024432 [Xenopus tropicalis]
MCTDNTDSSACKSFYFAGSLVLGTIQLLWYLSLAVYLGPCYLVGMDELILALTFSSMGICFTG